MGSVLHVVNSSSNLFLARAMEKFVPRPFIFLRWFVYAGDYLSFGLATAAWDSWNLFHCNGFFNGLAEPAQKALVANLVGN